MEHSTALAASAFLMRATISHFFAERLGRDHVGIVRGSMTDADLAVFFDDLFEADLRSVGAWNSACP
jgi:hypothetical protein